MEFWITLSWPQAMVLVLLGIPALIVIFFLFGGEIHFSGESKGKEPEEKPK